jgi:hypothetical protein
LLGRLRFAGGLAEQIVSFRSCGCAFSGGGRLAEKIVTGGFFSRRGFCGWSISAKQVVQVVSGSTFGRRGFLGWHRFGFRCAEDVIRGGLGSRLRRSWFGACIAKDVIGSSGRFGWSGLCGGSFHGFFCWFVAIK